MKLLKNHKVEPSRLRQDIKDRLYRRRYVVPNAVTLGNMFCGFLAIIYAASGRFHQATIAIAVAILLDGLDGRVARRLNATSKFGVEFDSFSDLVSFGVAPALLMYYWAFVSGADEFGVAVSFVFALCSASRLARFNIATENTPHFVGLPTPGAAGVIAAAVHCSPKQQSGLVIEIIGTILLLGIAYLMVSRIPFFSIKHLKFKSMRFLSRIATGLLIALIWYNSKLGLITLSLGYALSGPINWAWARFSGKPNRLSSAEPSSMQAVK